MSAVTDIDSLLKRNHAADRLRLTTAGSVDDGKSTLIGRLLFDSKRIYDDQLEAVEADSRRLNRETVDLALVTDGLKAEREQGITIDVAYRYFSTPSRRFIIADTPGHEQYTRNMVTGASTAELAIVLIDARHGVLTQSKRHAFIASLLGIPHMAVCVNKMDAVGYSQTVFETIREQFTAFCSRLNIPGIVYLPVSALVGDNVVNPGPNMPWYNGPSLLQHLETVQTDISRNRVDFRFPVQGVSRPNLDFRGFLGTVAAGSIRVGDTVAALPSGLRTAVSRIIGLTGDMEEAVAGQAITLCLDDEIDISRGDLLAHPNNVPHVSRAFEAMLVWMHATPLHPGRPYRLKHTHAWTKAVVTRLHYAIDPDTLHRKPAATLELNALGRASLECYQPVCWDPYASNRETGSAILVDPDTHATVGAVIIIERLMQADRPTGQPVSRNIRREASLVTAAHRQALLKQKPVTVWLTGLSGSGKSSIARELERRLIARGNAAFVLDGDNLRAGLNRDLGFSAADRGENIRRTAAVAALFNDAGLIVITALISPYRQDRRAAREQIGDARIIEVFVDAPLSVCEARDPKGLYRKAREGTITDLTGISAPYEPPEHPRLHLRTDQDSLDACVEAILSALDRRQPLPSAETRRT